MIKSVKVWDVSEKGLTAWRSDAAARRRAWLNAYGSPKCALGKRPSCERCGKDGRVKPHRFDSSRPLDITWLCPQCWSVLSTERCYAN